MMENKDILTIVPVKLGPKNESIVSVLEFLDKFVEEAKAINAVWESPRTYYLVFLVDPPGMAEQLEKEVMYYETTRPTLWPVSVFVCKGQGNYGSSLAAFLYLNHQCVSRERFIKIKTDIYEQSRAYIDSRLLSMESSRQNSPIIITELGGGFFLNSVLLSAHWWARNPLLDKHATIVFSRYGVPSNIFYFPTDEGRDHSPWFRRLGRRFVGWIFNLLVTSRFGWQDILDGATHDSRIYNGYLFESYDVLKPLFKALDGRNPQSSNIILLAWALSQKDSVVLSKPAEYHSTKSTLNFWVVLETFAMLFEIWYTTRILRRDWKGIVPSV